MRTPVAGVDLRLAVAGRDGRTAEAGGSAHLFAAPRYAWIGTSMRATPRLDVPSQKLSEDEATPVMAGRNPVIHPTSNGPSAEAMDPWVTPGGDANTCRCRSRKAGQEISTSARDSDIVKVIPAKIILEHRRKASMRTSHLFASCDLNVMANGSKET